MKIESTDAVEQVAFRAGDGLVPAIVQHADTGAVLMLAWMNRDALRATLAERRVVFFSRSRAQLWEKGATSGNALDLVAIHADCDRDALLVLARPRGPACHLGTRTCFGDEPAVPSESLAFITNLEGIIDRAAGGGAESYTARLLSSGKHRVAQKVGEEAVEVAIAATAGSDDEVVGESADLLFHLLVLLRARGLSLARVIAELEARHKQR